MAFHSPLLAVRVVVLRSEIVEGDRPYSVAVHYYEADHRSTIGTLSYSQALAMAEVMTNALEALHEAAEENIALASCTECEQLTPDVVCPECAEKCSTCENQATFCIDCAERVVRGLDGSRFRNENPLEPDTNTAEEALEKLGAFVMGAVFDDEAETAGVYGWLRTLTEALANK